jgi:glyoxylase-like metal-dependent hydrolase (beta-lactamase superfamily II)
MPALSLGLAAALAATPAPALAPQGCGSATVTTLGVPCGTASLSATLPVLGATMHFALDDTVPSQIGALLQSPGPGIAVPFLGCDIYLSQLDLTALFATDANGDASVPLAVANDPALCGSIAVVQGAMFSGTGSVLGLDVTNAVELRLGSAPPSGGTFPPVWIHGSQNCSTNTDPPIQVHQYAARTWILRQNACLDFEAPFLYLMVGNQKALLIDSGATSSASLFPVRATVQGLLDAYELANGLPDLQLIVAHSHAHGDHVQGDGQFAGQPNTTVVGTSLSSVQAFFGITSWPTQLVSYDLGGRLLDVIPTPGHHSTHICVYDAETGALCTGDTFYPGYLFISNLAAYKPSIARLVTFAGSHAITDILGGHIEMRSTPGLWYPYGTVYQPQEHELALHLPQLLELDAALQSITGSVTQIHDDFIINAF